MSTFHRMIHRLLTMPLNQVNYNIKVNTINKIAASNRYNPNLIDNIIKNKKKTLIYTDIYCYPKMVDSTPRRHYLDYIPKLTNNLSKKLNKFNTKKITTNKCKLGALLSNNKMKVPNTELSGIYKIKCNNCNAIYIGQSGRSFITPIKEHVQSVL